RILGPMGRRRALVLLPLVTAVAMAGPQGFTAPMAATASHHHRSHARRAHKTRTSRHRPSVGRAPASAASYYMRSIDRRQVWRMGCSFGSGVRKWRNPQDALVVLDFGSPMRHGHTYGARLFGYGFV